MQLGRVDGLDAAELHPGRAHGTDRDFSLPMNRFSLIPLVGGLWGTVACGHGEAGSAAASSRGGGGVDLAGGIVVARLAADPEVQRADSLVRAGRPWRASALLAPRLRAPGSASPELRLAGARAAAAWDGWTEVERILRGADWLDRRFGGEGRELLARGDLERGQDGVVD
ncbi:MAG: hypothetical protein JWN79_2850, partial [Gemmatimonadetes bacterium]|nr:hypothetical protein [Gemmatimonadota bacterium]